MLRALRGRGPYPQAHIPYASPPSPTPLSLLGNLLQLEPGHLDSALMEVAPTVCGGQNSAFLEMGLGAGTPSSLNEDIADSSTSPRKDEGPGVLRSGKGDWLCREAGWGGACYEKSDLEGREAVGLSFWFKVKSHCPIPSLHSWDLTKGSLR